MASESTEYICTQCGTQYAGAERPPEVCRICTDERQFVNPQGQQWTTHDRLKRTYRNTVHSQGRVLRASASNHKLGSVSARCWYEELTEMCCGTVSRCWTTDWRS